MSVRTRSVAFLPLVHRDEFVYIVPDGNPAYDGWLVGRCDWDAVEVDYATAHQLYGLVHALRYAADLVNVYSK